MLKLLLCGEMLRDRVACGSETIVRQHNPVQVLQIQLYRYAAAIGAIVVYWRMSKT